MALPYDLYIRYLATKGLDDLKEVNSKLEEIKLPYIKQEDLDRAWQLINGTLAKGVLSQIEKRAYGIDFLQNMKALEVDDMWLELPGKIKTKDSGTFMKLVFDIHQDNALRVTLNSLLIKGLKLEEIIRLVAAKFATNFRETHIDLYSRFFFNPKRMTRGDWKSFLKVCTANEQNFYFKALTEPADVLKTELDLPANISVSETLQWLLTKSFQRAKTCMNSPTPESGQEARAWVSQVVQLADKYEKYRSADQHDFAKALQMEFDFIDDPFDTPDSQMLADLEEKRKEDELKAKKEKEER